MMNTKSIGFIGGGKITRILLQGLKNKNLAFPSIKVCDTNNDALSGLKKEYPEIETAASAHEVVQQAVVFIALHPPLIVETISNLKASFNENSLVISLAPKFSIEKLSGLTGTRRVMRMIPNATTFINKGYNPVCFPDGIQDAEKKSIMETLQVLGKTFETEESKLEAYAVVSAMLPTYFWFQWKEMENIARETGLTGQESQETIFETLNAALEIMYNADMDYETVTDLIPVKPIGENEQEIKTILKTQLLGLFNKIKP